MAKKWILFVSFLLLIVTLPAAGCQPQPAPTATEQATPQPTPIETRQSTEVAPTATEPSVGREPLAAGEDWAYYEGDVPPFETNKYVWRRGRGTFGLVTSADKYDMDAGESVRIRFTLVNGYDEIEIVEPKEGPAMDIWVSHHSASQDSDEYWSDGREIPEELRRFELRPGESRTLEWSWTSWEKQYGTPVSVRGILNHQRWGEERVSINLCIESCSNGELGPFEMNQHSRRVDDFGIIISADRFYTGAEEPVRIRFTVTNDGDDEEFRESEEGPVMDIRVGYRGEISDWWSDGREITPEMKKLELTPGETRTIEMTWIPPDIDYSTSVDLVGVFRGPHRDTKVHTELCVDDGCADP
jgi:hypothetical protein